MDRRFWTASLICCLALLLAGPASGQTAPQRTAAPPKTEPTKPTKQELDGATHRLTNFEQKVGRMNGQPTKLDVDGKEALERIRSLKERFPDDPAVAALFERARVVLLASKGEIVQITPEMLAYRKNEEKLGKLFSELADKEWADLKAKALAAEGTIDKPFPQASREDTPLADMRGRYILLDDLAYPANQFTDFGFSFAYIGAPSRGFYFVQLSGPAWAGAYAAFKRYERLVNRNIPENPKWTVLGRITGIDLLVPQAGEDKTAPAQWGWTVEPVAIYMAGCTLAVADDKNELGGAFSGEADLEKIKSAMYTVKEIPADATPERVVEIFSIAIKEKNYPLYLDCIDPNRRNTPTALSLCLYHWDWHQHRFANFYAMIRIEPAVISVLDGFDAGSSVEDFYLTDEEREKVRKASGPLIEQAEVKTKAFDENGRQYGSPKPFFLRRIDKARWHIINFPQPF